MIRNIIVQSLILTLSINLSVSATQKAVTHISLQGSQDGSCFKVGDTEEDVTNCLGHPRGTISLPKNKKRLLFHGGGIVELSQGEVSNIILPDEDWPWSIWIALNKEQIISDISSTYKWNLLADKNTVAQGIWKYGDVKYRKQEHGGTFFSHPSVPAPFTPYFMKYHEGILVLSSTNGVKRAQLTFNDGKAQGPCRFWHPDGSLWMKGQYDGNVKEGNWAKWDLNGDLTKIEYLKGNHEIRTGGFSNHSIWRPSYGTPDPIHAHSDVRFEIVLDRTSKTALLKKGERIPFAEEIYDATESILTIYTLDGIKLMQFTLIKGDLEGKSLWWNLNGSMLREGQYKNNSPIGVWKFYKGNDYTTLECDGKNNWK
jgi:antitoxin component YwqK of YwqJK toxin-antitoxin module